ncbi:hypothetical protein FOMPIDRAFT_1060511 [Fomitopsis schrenkii]|uniref:RlpA-like protein double-psi beta-barrel domain-containing protein n=1 Tax=Fomitopsis schrenkii TaxID=2126942 RepID=S8FF89_FOMSC|nr:hypothetical protein FOMPIDRAFT_1060511 [Fomitopsis schrenkii]
MYHRFLLYTLFLFSLLGFGLGHLNVRMHRPRHHASWRRQTGRNSDENNGTLERRFDGARLTYYDAGQNACGGYDSDGDFVVALNAAQWDNGAHCYKTITIWYGSKSTQAKITDMCPGCPYGGLDLSRGLFGFLADLGLGVLKASWDFAKDGGSQPAVDLRAAYTPAAYTPAAYTPSAYIPSAYTPSAYTPYTVYAAPTTTRWAPTPTYRLTSTHSSPTSFSSSSSFKTLTLAFGSYSSYSGISTSTTVLATPSATATQAKTVAFDQGTLNRVNLAIVGLGALVDFAQRA